MISRRNFPYVYIYPWGNYVVEKNRFQVKFQIPRRDQVTTLEPVVIVAQELPNGKEPFTIYR